MGVPWGSLGRMLRDSRKWIRKVFCKPFARHLAVFLRGSLREEFLCIPWGAADGVVAEVFVDAFLGILNVVGDLYTLIIYLRRASQTFVAYPPSA